MEFKLFNVMLSFLLHNFRVEDACTHQIGLERGYGSALKFPALRLAEFHVEPKRALRALLHPGLLAQAADHAADVRGIAVVVGQHIECGRFAVHKAVDLVSGFGWNRDGAIDLVGVNRDGFAVRRVLIDFVHKARHAFLLRRWRVQRRVRACFEETFDRIGLWFGHTDAERF
eukprot:6201151-Pleurochrysis_carterae.AAC.3